MRISFIGSVGIPNCYGGFESFLEVISPLIVKSNIIVNVTCDSKKYIDKNPLFKGVNRIFININANGFLSPIHDLLAFFRVLRISDVIIVLGVSAGPFFIIMRFFCFLLNKKLIINIDGIEWRRSKYSTLEKIILRIFDLFAQISAHRIIYDNSALINYIYLVFHKKSFLIPYSGDHVVRIKDVSMIPGSGLSICRIEPENNIDLILKSVVNSNLTSFTIIGNWNNSSYGKNLREKYKNFVKLKLLDPIYDPLKVASFRESCFFYIHGHSVGGTNPSLVEMLSYNAIIVSYDCIFNRESAGNSSLYFTSSDDLVEILNNSHLLKSNSSLGELPLRYTSQVIANQYISCAEF
jgi:hypothetical protein